jgi:protein-S-isoprenylcysteine O-methyltransferase Ste14
MNIIVKLIAFIVLSIPLVIISYRSIIKPGSHGFYRFLAWEGIMLLLVNNIQYWFTDPFSFHQIVSWIFLFVSIYLVIIAVYHLKKYGKSRAERQDSSLLEFEKTTSLVDSGIYKYIRHPMYSSLLFLTWGIFLKYSMNPVMTGTSFLTTIFLIETALIDEKECISYFGNSYREYMKRTKRFIPFVF